MNKFDLFWNWLFLNMGYNIIILISLGDSQCCTQLTHNQQVLLIIETIKHDIILQPGEISRTSCFLLFSSLQGVIIVTDPAGVLHKFGNIVVFYITLSGHCQPSFCWKYVNIQNQLSRNMINMLENFRKKFIQTQSSDSQGGGDSEIILENWTKWRLFLEDNSGEKLVLYSNMHQHISNLVSFCFWFQENPSFFLLIHQITGRILYSLDYIFPAFSELSNKGSIWMETFVHDWHRFRLWIFNTSDCQ